MRELVESVNLGTVQPPAAILEAFGLATKGVLVGVIDGRPVTLDAATGVAA